MKCDLCGMNVNLNEVRTFESVAGSCLCKSCFAKVNDEEPLDNDLHSKRCSDCKEEIQGFYQVLDDILCEHCYEKRESTKQLEDQSLTDREFAEILELKDNDIGTINNDAYLKSTVAAADSRPDSPPDKVMKALCIIVLAIGTAIASIYLSMITVGSVVFHGHQSAWGFEFIMCLGAPIPALLGFVFTFLFLDAKKSAYERSVLSAISGTIIACVAMVAFYGVLMAKGNAEAARVRQTKEVGGKFWKSYFENYSTYPTSRLQVELKEFGTERDSLQSQLSFARSDRIDDLVKILAGQRQFTLLKILIERVNLSRSSADLIFSTAYTTIDLKNPATFTAQSSAGKKGALNYTPPQLAREKSSAVGALVALAENRSTPPYILEKLGHFPVMHVVRAVIENPNSPESIYRSITHSTTPPADFYNLNKEIYFHGGSGEWNEIVERAEGAHKNKIKRLQAINLANKARRAKDFSLASKLYLDARELDANNAEACIMGEYTTRKAGIVVDRQKVIGHSIDNALQDLVDKHGGWYDLDNTQLIMTALFLTKQQEKAFDLMAKLRRKYPDNRRLEQLLKSFPEKSEQVEAFLSPRG